MIHTIESLEPRQFLAFALNVNFQPSGTPVPAGYVADTGQLYASRGTNTFGWNLDNSSADRDRNATSDQRYDTLTHTQLYGNRTWELSVPNGQYSVRVVAGDPSYFDSSYKINAEGVLTVNGAPTSSSRFVEGTKTVTVSDGRLTISNAAGASNNKIAFIEVASVGSPTLPAVSIAATDSTASELAGNTGTLKVTRTGSTSAALTVNYTIGGSATNGTDYNTLSGSVVIPAGSISANIIVTPKVDALVEGTESAVFTLTGSSAYTIGSAAASVSIADANAPSSDFNWPTTWTLGPNIPKPRWESSSVAMDGKIWVFGGWMAASSTGTQQVDVFDVASRTWSTLKNYAPIPHTHSALAADPANHTIYFVGGLFGSFPGIPTNRAWKFNTLNLTWTELPSMNENHSSGGAMLVNGELHYIGGVLDDRETNTASHVVLSLNNLAAGWKTAPSMPDARDHFGSVVLNGKIIIVGGEFGHDVRHDQQSLVDSYDPISKTWTRLASLPIAKSHMESSTFVTPDGKIISAGGQVEDYKSTDNVAMYNPATNRWTTIGALPMALQGPVVQMVGNEIIVTSGNPKLGPLGTTWIGEWT